MSPTRSDRLGRIDPAEAWQPWQPTAAQPFDLKWAGHLYRRAAFGASMAELRKAVERGLAPTLELLLNGPPDAEAREQFLVGLGETMIRDDQAGSLRGWWIYVLLHTPHPLRERMTLFWHNHFATSIAKVQRVDMIYAQNKLIRRNALGSFRPFLLAMSRDPAMLAWLDSNSNVKGKPNENYARELMELFCLGVGNYTEGDVREAARAFTGWHTDGTAFAFDSAVHDDDKKTVLGQTGAWNGDDIVRICLEQPAAARFLVRKLYKALVSEATTPPDALLEPLVAAFRKSDYDIGALVQTMLRSRHFFSDHAYRQRVKSPVELVLGAVREVAGGLVAPLVLTARLEAMGQLLFAPPNVKGWEGGTNWLNTATLLARHNFAHAVSAGALGAASNLGRFFESGKAPSPADIVRVLADVFFQGDLRPDVRARLVAFVAESQPSGGNLEQRARAVAQALMTMPEYQLA